MGDTEDQHEPGQGRVLSNPEAFGLLSNSNEYFNHIELINGRHPTEILAEAMLQAGHESLATAAMQIHDTMRQFHRGDFKAVQFFTEGPVFERLVENADGTKFEEAATSIVRNLVHFAELIPGDAVDWEKSSEMLADLKRRKFPEDLTMVEKIDQWQRGQGKTPG